MTQREVDERRLRFLITMMFRAVFHNRMLLDMITVGLGKQIEGDKKLCAALADVYSLCEAQESELAAQGPEDRKPWSGIPPDHPEIEAAMKILDQGVAQLLYLLKPKQGYAFEKFTQERKAGNYDNRPDEVFRETRG